MQLFLIFLVIFQLEHAMSLAENCSAEDFHICRKCTNVECEVHEDNLIGSIASVMSSEECQNWCKRRNNS